MAVGFLCNQFDVAQPNAFCVPDVNSKGRQSSNIRASGYRFGGVQRIDTLRNGDPDVDALLSELKKQLIENT